MTITPLGFAKAHGPNTSSPQFSTTHRGALALQQPQRDAPSRVLSRALLLRLPALHGRGGGGKRRSASLRSASNGGGISSSGPFPPLPPVTSPTPVKLTVRAPVPSLARACSGWGCGATSRGNVSGLPHEIEAVFALSDNPLRVACSVICTLSVTTYSYSYLYLN